MSNMSETIKPKNQQPQPPFDKEGISPPGLEADMKQKPKFRAPDYKPANKLKDKVALITGGDSGIGRATAYLFAKEGAHVTIACLESDVADAKMLQKEIKEETDLDIDILTGDVTDFDFCKSICEQTAQKRGQIDLLVNNAAFQESIENFEDLSIEHWHKTFHTNIDGYFYMVKAALPHLPKGSAIINVGSITGLEGAKNLIDYSSTKGAIHAFTKSLAQNFVDRGIRVNAVAPGPIWTPLNPAERDYEDYENFGKGQPYGRPGQPEEVAPLLVFLASNADSAYISGEVIGVLGGQTTAG
jgi:NAD(P)-dependent dehydrogenase (short-subunit alcohol dehydrogenase family)